MMIVALNWRRRSPPPPSLAVSLSPTYGGLRRGCPSERPQHIDKYYIEPGPGRSPDHLEQFRSILMQRMWHSRVGAGRRVLQPAAGRAKSSTIVSSYMDGMTESELAGLAASETAAKSHYDLPDGWVMEEVPRKKRDSSHTFKYYYEPGTGKKFRSLAAAKKHVAASNEGDDLHKPLAKESRLPQSLKNQASYAKKRTEPSSSADLPEKDEQPPSYDEVPKSVNWVLESFDEPHVWKAYINGREVPASVSREWQEEASQEWHAFRKFRKGSG